MKRIIFVLATCGCVTPRQTADSGPPEYSIALLHGELPPTSGCYVIYYDKPTGEVNVELNAIDNEGSNFCLTDAYHD